ncbi:hypothetical protein [uncultured Eudoraea sp.]|uniref:hypothetical protein n=1 Tax=uncultured Eudoraea sp. TaxID=1035614 RepID=UPI002620E5B4|nr:hypothetical protein [uncultured Eudoraea sp.]
MKNIIFGVLIATSVLITFGFVYEENESSDTPDKQWVIAPRFYTLQDGVSKEEAREWLENEYLLLYREFPGFNCQVGEPVSSGGWGTKDNKAKDKGDFVMVYFFDSKETRDYYFPEDGSWSEAIVNGIAKHQSTFDQLFGKYFIQDKYQNEEYMMFASSK